MTDGADTASADEPARLAALRECKLLDGKVEKLFPKLVRYAARVTGCPTAMISVVDAERQWFPVRFGMSLASTPRGHSFCAHAILRPEAPLIVPDAALDPRFAHNPLVLGAPFIRFYAGVPLVTADGHAVGTLCVLDAVPHAIEPEEIEALRRLADTIRVTMELRRMVRQKRVVALTRVMTARQGQAIHPPANGDRTREAS